MSMNDHIELRRRCGECRRRPRLDRRIAVRLAETEVADISARVERAGGSVSDFVRHAIRRQLRRSDYEGPD